ncbi:MAG: DUF2555 domain-containing protein [Oscillatoriales cyanobacterium]|jgi:Protein of unknown function (DUF2555)|nr:MAG: DUF2555 domain-containing protein [Oscillatoriales cyanobacterium]
MTAIDTAQIHAMSAQDVRALADRLEADEYPTPFAGLQDWHLLRAIAYEHPELVEPYLHLLEFEDCDES